MLSLGGLLLAALIVVGVLALRPLWAGRRQSNCPANWARRAFHEWAFRPKRIRTYLKITNNWQSARSAINVGWQALGWMR